MFFQLVGGRFQFFFCLVIGIGSQAGWYLLSIRLDMVILVFGGFCFLTVSVLELREQRFVGVVSGIYNFSQCFVLDEAVWGFGFEFYMVDWIFGRSRYLGVFVQLGRDWKVLCFREEGVGVDGQDQRVFVGRGFIVQFFGFFLGFLGSIVYSS